MKFENIKVGAHPVEDWEFQFAGGAAIQITVDEDAGDHVSFKPEAPTVFFHLAEKPSPVDPDGTSPEEDLFIPMANVLCVRKTKRILEPPSPEEKEAWQNLLKEMTNNSHFGN